MTPSCFELLCALERSPTGSPAKALARDARLPASESLRILGTLQTEGLALAQEDLWTITERGREALEPYRVKRAVILAAGFGSRLRPITCRIPKPLIPVKGVRMIDTVLDALTAAGIQEIHIIRGYQGTCFDALLKKYPQVILTDNPNYATSNNLHSALFAKDWLENAYLLDADLCLFNPRLIRKFELRTHYLGCWCEETTDWCFRLNGDFIQSVSMTGGRRCYRMIGLSYWNQEDGRRLGRDLAAIALHHKTDQLFWDEIPLRLCRDHYRLALRPCAPGDVLEIDTLEELAEADPVYRAYLPCLANG